MGGASCKIKLWGHLFRSYLGLQGGASCAPSRARGPSEPGAPCGAGGPHTCDPALSGALTLFRSGGGVPFPSCPVRFIPQEQTLPKGRDVSLPRWRIPALWNISRRLVGLWGKTVLMIQKLKNGPGPRAWPGLGLGARTCGPRIKAQQSGSVRIFF